MKKAVLIPLVLVMLCLLAAGCGNAGKNGPSSDVGKVEAVKEKTAAEESAAEKPGGKKSEIAEKAEKTQEGDSAAQIDYDPSSRVSWFPLDVLLPNTWEGISARAKAYGLKTLNSGDPISPPLMMKYIRSPKDPVNDSLNKKNSAWVLFVTEDGPLASLGITDLDFNWDLIERYPEENPCLDRLAVLYHDRVPEVAVGEFRLEGSDDPIAFTFENRKEFGTEFVFGHLPAMHDYYPGETPDYHASTFEEVIDMLPHGSGINGTYEIVYLKE